MKYGERVFQHKKEKDNQKRKDVGGKGIYLGDWKLVLQQNQEKKILSVWEKVLHHLEIREKFPNTTMKKIMLVGEEVLQHLDVEEKVLQHNQKNESFREVLEQLNL